MKRAVLLALLLPLVASAGAPERRTTLAEFAAALRSYSHSADGGKADYEEVSFGKEIAISNLAVKGKVTIVDFASDFCPPCLRSGVVLIKLAKAHPEKYALRRVNINRPGIRRIDWDSPVARRYSLESIPHLVIFDESGSKVAEGEEADAWLSARGLID